MKLQNLIGAKNLILQIIWGEKNIEFSTEIVDRDDEGIYVTPYMHNKTPLELNINMQSGVVCNLFGDSPDTGKRISWRNIELSTTNYCGSLVYYLKTSIYNSHARIDERRVEDRVRITKTAELFDPISKKTVVVRVNDVSDGGIAFYAPATFQPETNLFVIKFSDVVNDQEFELTVKCKVVRTKKMPGTVFYGCRVLEDNTEYLLYGCLMRLSKNASGESVNA